MSNVPKSSTAPVVMDARKFVRTVNNSAAAKLKFFESAVARMGQSVGKNLRLTSLDANNVIYEDVEKNVFYIADIKKGNQGKVDLENVRPIQVVEEDKASQYEKNVRDLVESVCDGKLTQADKIFNKIEGQRFRSKVIPESGWITLKDGVSYHVPVSTRIVKEDHAANIVKLFTEAVRDNIEVDKGRIIRGTLSDGHQKFVIPINEYTRRRLVAHKMREVAEGAYKSKSFQDLVVECAALVCENKIDQAVKLAAKFLSEEQEFSLLNSNQMKSLVESTLATRAQFNSMLASDTATLLYKTNSKVNRHNILEAWTKMAQKSEQANILTNVNILAESEDFEGDYEKFLDIVFNEEMDIQSARAKAYRTTLRVISSILPDLEDEEGEGVSASVDELNELIERLSNPEADTDAILQAEELLAGISDSLIDSIQDLEGFDAMPGEEGAEEGESEDEGDLVPLPEVGGGEEESEEEVPPLPGEEEGVPGAEGEEEEEETPLGPPMESKQHKLVPVESMAVNHLQEQLNEWKLHGESFLREFGYDQCYSDMERYIKRCIELGPKASSIRENFEGMRGLLVDTGTEVLAEDDDDLYSNSVMAALNGSDRLLESNNPKDPERDPAFWGKKKNSTSEGRINKEYRHTFLEGDQPWEAKGGLKDAGGLSMSSDFQGKGGVAEKTPKASDGRSASGGSAAGFHAPQKGQGVAKKGVKPVDGRKGEHSTSGAAGGSTRMDDLRGSGGVSEKSPKSSDGRKAGNTKGNASESTIPVSGGDPALAKGGFTSVGLSMGSDFQGKGKGGVVQKKLAQGDGASGDGASGAKNYEASGGPSSVGHDMSEFQGKDGLEDDNLDSSKLKGQGKVKSDGGLKAANKGGDMSTLQGKGGVAESITPERIAALIAELDGEDESAVSESLECGCPCAGSCKEKADCKCESACPCKGEAMAEGEVPEAFKKNWGKKKKDAADSKDEPAADSKPADPKKPFKDGDEVENEAQYKGTSKKFKTGFKRSSISQEGQESTGKTLTEQEKIAAFIGSPEDVAMAVDKALSGGGGLDDLNGMSGTPPPPVSGPPESLDAGMDAVGAGMEPEEGELEDSLDSALGGESEGPEGPEDSEDSEVGGLPDESEVEVESSDEVSDETSEDDSEESESEDESSDSEESEDSESEDGDE